MLLLRLCCPSPYVNHTGLDGTPAVMVGAQLAEDLLRSTTTSNSSISAKGEFKIRQNSFVRRIWRLAGVILRLMIRRLRAELVVFDNPTNVS